MILSFINIRKVPRKVLETFPPRFFQHFPRELANVNEWKIMFNPSLTVTCVISAGVLTGICII